MNILQIIGLIAIGAVLSDVVVFVLILKSPKLRFLFLKRLRDITGVTELEERVNELETISRENFL